MVFSVSVRPFIPCAYIVWFSKYTKEILKIIKMKYTKMGRLVSLRCCPAPLCPPTSSPQFPGWPTVSPTLLPQFQLSPLPNLKISQLRHRESKQRVII